MMSTTEDLGKQDLLTSSANTRIATLAVARHEHGTTASPAAWDHLSGSSASAARCLPSWWCGVNHGAVGDGRLLALPIGLAVEHELVGG